MDQICLGLCNDPVAPTNQVAMATEPLIYDYLDYVYSTENPAYHDVVEGAPPLGAKWRRILAMPVANCTGDQTGQSELEVIGFACYYMLQPIGGGVDKNIFGQFVKGCLAGGAPGPNPGAGLGPYLIQLYKDPDSTDS